MRQVIVVFVMAAGVLTGCATSGEDGTADRSASHGQEIPFDLYTHCGIDEARIGSTYFEAEVPLSDGSGNPPDGWDNPTQRGTMTLKSETEAVFTDGAGHEVYFRARTGASTFKHVCA
ncbi:hypothetical protein M2158_007964 [Streptomyces sp. SAI-144]|jgi:hypothetical protein|uniref:hypothetical protein n=1 Tax=Streptomyces sp. SAI-144 TaxID=2940544 RepID=UPI002476747C|nr:hypothetical protein [Streptomyces sp. SAI-144]MDH6439423.1 hypothetical protein [Streptomyces sp. SAI-144]